MLFFYLQHEFFEKLQVEVGDVDDDGDAVDGGDGKKRMFK